MVPARFAVILMVAMPLALSGCVYDPNGHPTPDETALHYDNVPPTYPGAYPAATGESQAPGTDGYDPPNIPPPRR
jgi:hypothetical protein